MRYDMDEIEKELLRVIGDLEKIKAEISLLDNVCDDFKERLREYENRTEHGPLKDVKKYEKIYELRKTGKTLTEIAKTFDISTTRARDIYQRHCATIQRRVWAVGKVIDLYKRREECPNCVNKMNKH